MKLLHKGLILISVPLAFEVFFVVGFADLLHRSMKTIDAEVRTKDLIGCMDRLGALFSESIALSSMSHVHSNPEFSRRYAEVWQDVDVTYKRLQKLQAGRPGRQADLDDLAHKIKLMRELNDFVRNSDAMENYQGLASSMLGIKINVPDVVLTWHDHRSETVPLYRMVDRELKELGDVPALHEAIREHFQRFLSIGIAVNALIVFLMSWFFGSSIVRRLKNVMDNTIRLGALRPLNAPMGGSDEIAVLDSSLHDAAAEIINAELFKQQLVGVVSHELKAPLSAVQSQLAMLSDGLFGALSDGVKVVVLQAETSCQRLIDVIMKFLEQEKNSGAPVAPDVVLPSGEARNAHGWRMWHKGLLLIGLPFVIELVFMAVLAGLLQQAESDVLLQRYSRDLLSQLEGIIEADGESTLFFSVEVAFKDPRMAVEYRKRREYITQSLSDLRLRVQGNPEREKLVSRIAEILDMGVGIRDRYLSAASLGKAGSSAGSDAYAAKSFSDLLPNTDVSKEIFKCNRLLSAATNKFTAYETEQESQFRVHGSGLFESIDRVLIIGMSINGLLAVGLLAFLIKDITSRVDRITENAGFMLARQPLHDPMMQTDEISELDAAFHRVNEEIGRQQKIKRELAAIASTQLKDPLLSIRNALAELLTGTYGLLEKHSATQVALAESATVRLIQLINDLLSVEKMEAGKFVLELQQCNLADIVSQAVVRIEGIAQFKKVKLDTAGESATITGDAERLIQALVNLISNAIKFSPTGETVTVVSECSEGKALVRVVDRGIGIPADKQHSLFQRFHRVEGTDAYNPSGSGLGLVITKLIVEQHGGRVWLESEQGKGATFVLEVPLGGPQ